MQEASTLNVSTAYIRCQLFTLGLVYQAQLVDCFKMLAQVEQAKQLALSSENVEGVRQAEITEQNIHASLEHSDLYTSCIGAIS